MNQSRNHITTDPAIFGLSGFMFVNQNTIMGYLFLGLAVLTAPHLQIMHDMYHQIRSNKTIYTT